jgi:uncharacterized SAM-dependent methyltransferase
MMRMQPVARVAIHASQFPDAVRRDLLESLRTRVVNHKFLYDSPGKTQKWLLLHQACSPSRTDDDCFKAYEHCFAAAALRVHSPRVHVIGLGCGGGKKDARLLNLLKRPGRELFYTPLDVSTAMVLVAREASLGVIEPENGFPMVCDLASPEDPSAAIREQSLLHSSQILTFFGMLPNFEPALILKRLASVLPSDGLLLLSANLAPGNDYAAGVRSILPLYDNLFTREWLALFLQELGVDPAVGQFRFRVEEGPGETGLWRIAAFFDFARPCVIKLDEEVMEFAAGDSIRLFFSYRHTPAIVRDLLARVGLSVQQEWVSVSGEEGVFLVARE